MFKESRYANVQELIGKTLTKVIKSGLDDEIFFIVNNEEAYKMYHDQSCCECVTIEDICGDLNDLVGSPIIVAEEASNSEEREERDYDDDSFTWTFYKLATNKGYVTIRWYGSSNGYYSESVDFEKGVWL
jgi:hypothetical protein